MQFLPYRVRLFPWTQGQQGDGGSHPLVVWSPAVHDSVHILHPVLGNDATHS